MAQSFSSLCITNTICLTSIWILIGLGLFVSKMQKDQDIHDVFDGMSLDEMLNLKIEEDNTYYLRVLTLATISKSLIWLGFVLDNAVCFTEFMVVWLKVQAPPVFFYLFSVGRYVTYILSVVIWYDLKEQNYTWVITIQLVFLAFCRIFSAVAMCCMNKEMSNEVDGINNPVVYAVGLTGKKAMAGA